MPERNVPYDRIMLPTVIEAYYNRPGDTAKATRLSERLFTIMEENMAWYLSLSPAFADKVSDDMGLAQLVMQRLGGRGQDATGQDDLGPTSWAHALPKWTPCTSMKLEDIATQGHAHHQGPVLMPSGMGRAHAGHAGPSHPRGRVPRP
jgi:hypothetical protein